MKKSAEAQNEECVLLLRIKLCWLCQTMVLYSTNLRSTNKMQPNRLEDYVIILWKPSKMS